MGKKGKNILPTILLEKKNSWWPEITHLHPQELNGRPLTTVNRGDPVFFTPVIYTVHLSTSGGKLTTNHLILRKMAFIIIIIIIATTSIDIHCSIYI